MSRIRQFIEKKQSDYKRHQDYLRLVGIEKEARRKFSNSSSDDSRQYLIISGFGMEKIGLYCCMLAFIPWVQYAESKGLIPVIDMQNVKSQYLDSDELGRINAWEYYFKPFFNTMGQGALEQALVSDNYKVVNRLDKPSWMKKKEFNNLLSAGLDKESFLKNFKHSEEAQSYIDQVRKSLFKDGDKVLGVLCRGSDYVNLKPSQHPIQPDIDQLKQKTQVIYNEYGCNKIYVATEDAEYLQKLKDYFGEHLVYLDCKRITTTGSELTSDAFERIEVNKKQNGMDYLTSIYLLSLCDCIIAGQTSATPFIRLMRDDDKDFEYYYEWDLGRYK